MLDSGGKEGPEKAAGCASLWSLCLDVRGTFSLALSVLKPYFLAAAECICRRG